MPLGMELGLGPGHNVLEGTQLSPPKKEAQPPFPPMFIVANGWMDQDATWYEGRSRPRPYCVT